VDDPLARQMLGQRFAAVRRTVFLRARCFGWLGGCGGAHLAFRNSFLEIAEQQFHLLNFAIELLRGSSEPRPLEQDQLGFQVLDLQRLGVEFRVAHSDDAVAFRQQRLFLSKQLPQHRNFIEMIGSVENHNKHSIRRGQTTLLTHCRSRQNAANHFVIQRAGQHRCEAVTSSRSLRTTSIIAPASASPRLPG
jgi:hypothetical protein